MSFSLDASVKMFNEELSGDPIPDGESDFDPMQPVMGSKTNTARASLTRRLVSPRVLVNTRMELNLASDEL